MKRLYILFFTAILANALSAATLTRYFVGKTEVDEAFWNQMPDSLDYVTSVFEYDTLTVKSRELPLTHYLDSVSAKGKYVLAKRTPESIAELERVFAMINRTQREKSLSVSVGEQAPQIRLLRYKDKIEVDSLILPGHCYLLSFWATWCGNCLHELKPEFIPSVAAQFDGEPSFHFVAVCIDATWDDIQKFFSNQPGKRWRFLSEYVYLDTDRKANEQYGESGVMPLNVVYSTAQLHFPTLNFSSTVSGFHGSHYQLLRSQISHTHHKADRNKENSGNGCFGLH